MSAKFAMQIKSIRSVLVMSVILVALPITGLADIIMPRPRPVSFDVWLRTWSAGQPVVNWWAIVGTSCLALTVACAWFFLSRGRKRLQLLFGVLWLMACGFIVLFFGRSICYSYHDNDGDKFVVLPTHGFGDTSVPKDATPEQKEEYAKYKSEWYKKHEYELREYDRTSWEREHCSKCGAEKEYHLYWRCMKCDPPKHEL